MSDNPLWNMRSRGQGVWLRGFRRRLADSGMLDEMIRESAVSGLDCDLISLAGAVSRGPEYGESLLRIVAEDGDLEPAESLLAEEARTGAHLLRTVYRESDGRDGLVSVDAGSVWANDAESMSRAARRIGRTAEAPNVLPKLPPTDSGFAVFEALTAESFGVHIGPLFSLAAVDRAVDAFLRGARARAGNFPAGVSPLAVISFGVAPLDVVVDELLREKIHGAGGRDTSAAESLLGGTATALAMLAYRRLRERLAAEVGASSQRELGMLLLAFADVATADARQPRCRYVEALTGPDTAVVVSPGLLRDIGRGAVKDTSAQTVGEAEELLGELEDLEIDAGAIGAALEARTVRRRAAAYGELSRVVELATEALTADADRARAVASTGTPWWSSRPEIDDAVVVDVVDTKLDEAVSRMWSKDASLWSDDPQTGEAIRNRLGWLDAAAEEAFAGSEPLRRFAARLEKSDIERVLLLGMGGSSLAAEVCSRVFGTERVRVLDSTVPGHIHAVSESVDPARTALLVASKSGTTTEVRALLDYFYALAAPLLESPGERFSAITDPGTPLEQTAHERDFQRLWLAPPDVGGRFSALTVFGTLPMAIMGIETSAVLASARRMATQCAAEVPAAANPAARLASAMHQALAAGRDKLTLLSSPSLAAFGVWAEQLVAESTGKQGKGVVPVVSEPVGSVDEYGDDRLFVWTQLQEEEDAEARGHVDALEAAGHPVVRIVLQDRHDIGGEFFRWEAAVALLGALMEINPFDQPDVQASKDRTAAILAGDEGAAGIVDMPPAAAGNGWAIFADLERDAELATRLSGADMTAWLKAHLGRAAAPEYVGIQAFVPPQRTAHRALQRLRVLLRQRRGVATTLGWGPRFLHSTGQLHKGGPDTALFLQITADDAEDIDVPGAGYTFGRLARAQSLGDFAALQERGRRVVRVHLSDAARGCQALFDAAVEALR